MSTQTNSSAYSDFLSDLPNASIGDGGAPVGKLLDEVKDLKRDALDDPEVAASVLRLSEEGPTDEPKHSSHWKKLCTDETDPAEVQAALAASAVVSDVLAR